MFRRKKPKHKVAYVSALNSEKRSKAPSVSLDCGSDFVSSVQSLPSSNLFATFSHDGIVRVYSMYTKGDIYREYTTHNTNVMSLVHLFEDVLAFVGDNGKIVTWHADSGELVDELRPGSYHFTSIEKLNATQLVVGTVEGEVLIISHIEGRNLKIQESLGNLHSKTIKDISVDGDIIVTGGTDKTTVVYDRANSEQIASLRCNYWVRYVCVNDKYIITGAQDRKIYIRKNAIDCPNYLTVEFGDILQGDGGESVCVMAVSFITADLIMCTTFDNGILFFSLETAECIVRLNPKTEKGLQTAAILPDGRICVVGNSGYCAIFNAPVEVRDAVERFSENLRHPAHSSISLSSPVENRRSLWPRIQSPKDGPEFGTVVIDASDTSVNDDMSSHEDHNEDLSKELLALKAESEKTSMELAAQKELLAAQKAETDRVLMELTSQVALFDEQKVQTEKLLKTIEIQNSNAIKRENSHARSLPDETETPKEKEARVRAVNEEIEAFKDLIKHKEEFQAQREETEKLLKELTQEKKIIESSKREDKTVLLKQLAAQKAETNMVLIELTTQKEESQAFQDEQKKKLEELKAEAENRRVENQKIAEQVKAQQQETNSLIMELNVQKSDTSKLLEELELPAKEGEKKLATRAQISSDIEKLKSESRELKLLHSKQVAEIQRLTTASEVFKARKETAETGDNKLAEELETQKKELSLQKEKSAKEIEDLNKSIEKLSKDLKALKETTDTRNLQSKTSTARGLALQSEGSKETKNMKEEISKLREELSEQKKLIAVTATAATATEAPAKKQEDPPHLAAFGPHKFEARKMKLELEELRSLLTKQTGKTESVVLKTQLNAAQEEIQALKKLFKTEIAKNKETPGVAKGPLNGDVKAKSRPKSILELAVEKEETETLNKEFKRQKIEMDKLWKELNAQRKEFDAQRNKSKSLFKEWEHPETSKVANGTQKFESQRLKNEIEDLKSQVQDSKKQLAKQMRDIQQLSAAKQGSVAVKNGSAEKKKNDNDTNMLLKHLTKELEEQKAITRKVVKEMEEYRLESTLALREIESEKTASLKDDGPAKIESKKMEAELDRMEAELDMRKVESRQQKAEVTQLMKELVDHKKETAWQKESMKKLILDLEDQKHELEAHKTETLKVMKDVGQKHKSENREVLHEFASRKASFDATISRKTSYDSMVSPARKVSTFVSKKGETKKLLAELEKQKVEASRILKVLAAQKSDADSQKEEMLILMKEFGESKAASAKLLQELADRKEERDNLSVSSSKNKVKKSFGLARSTSQALGISKKSEGKKIMKELELQKGEVHRIVMEMALQKEETDLQKQETRKVADEVEAVKMEASSMFLELETQKEELEAQKSESKKMYKELSIQKSRTRKIYRELKNNNNKSDSGQQREKAERMNTDEFSVSVASGNRDSVTMRRNTHTDGFKSPIHVELD